MKRVVLTIIAVPLVIVVAYVGFTAVSFKDHRVTQGAAYGFVVGESAAETYMRARALESQGVYEEFRVGRGSAAVLLDANDDDATHHPHWQLVVDRDWWNNTIYLTFDDGTLTEIRRFRLWGEMP